MNKKQFIHKKNILTKGYTVIKNVISEKECQKIKKKAVIIYKKFSKYYKNENDGEETIYNLHNKDKIFIKYLNNKKILPIVQSILSKGAYQNKDFLILRQSALRNPKLGYEQQLHNDSRISGAKIPLIVQVVWLIDDFTKYNGATRVVPYTQNKSHFPKNKKKYSNEKIITGKKGSVIIFDAAVWHGSAKKTVLEERWGMIFSYSRWFLKPSFNHIQNTPQNIFNSLSKSQKEILGFRFNPPKDEFESLSSRSKKFKRPVSYKLPK